MAYTSVGPARCWTVRCVLKCYGMGKCHRLSVYADGLKGSFVGLKFLFNA